MKIDDFIFWCRKNTERVTHYRNGGDGSKDGGCDCIGLIIGAWRLSGNKWVWTHGTNYTARFLLSDKKAIDSAANLKPGMLVLKSKIPGAAGYALPVTYRNHPDQNDYYHIGIVLNTKPLDIIHCTNVSGGIKHDTALGQWKYCGYFNKLEIENMSIYQATVIADSGNTVNLRSGPGTAYSLVAKIKIGALADIKSAAGDGWAYVQIGKNKGYMQTKFLSDPSQSSLSDRDILQKAIEQLDMAEKEIMTVRASLNSIFVE